MQTAPPFSLKNKTALITGGGTGIGFGIAKCFVEAGAQVVISGRRKEILNTAVKRLGENADWLIYDVTQRSEASALADSLFEKYGKIDVLVNNAGRHLKKAATETSDAEFDAVLETNLLSVFTLTREFGKRMAQKGGGSIIQISSMTGLFGMGKVAAYGTSKTALIGMNNQLINEFSQDRVRLNAIAPGWIQSDMLEQALNADPERKAKILSRIPFGAFGAPEDIGNAAVYLASDAAKYVTGITLPVDGGAVYAF